MRIALVALSALVLAACSETKPSLAAVLPPEVAITTVPASCNVAVDGADRGISPLVYKAPGPPTEAHKLTFAKDGYLPAEITLTGEEVKKHTGEQMLLFLRPGMWDPKTKPIDVNNAVHLTRAGQDLSKAGRHAEAIPYLERALEVDQRVAPAHKALGTCYAKVGNSSKALEHYKSYLQYAPDAPDAPKVRSIVEKASGDIDFAPAKKRE